MYYDAPRMNPEAEEGGLRVRTIFEEMFPIIQVEYYDTINTESSINYFEWLTTSSEFTKQNATWYFKNQNEIIVDLQPPEDISD